MRIDPGDGVFLVTRKQDKYSVQQATDNYIQLMIDVENSLKFCIESFLYPIRIEQSAESPSVQICPTT